VIPRIRWIDAPGGGRIVTTPHPEGAGLLDLETATLREAGAGGVLSLLEDSEVDLLDLGEEEACCARHGMEFFRFPVPDHSVPESPEAFRAFLQPLASRIRKGFSLCIHCWGGIGRSNLTAACLLILLGLDAEEALRGVRRSAGLHVPETREQEAWVRAFRKRCGGPCAP